MAATHIVLRAIVGPEGRKILAGTRVDASRWRNCRTLVGAGRLRTLSADELREGPARARRSPKPKATAETAPPPPRTTSPSRSTKGKGGKKIAGRSRKARGKRGKGGAEKP